MVTSTEETAGLEGRKGILATLGVALCVAGLTVGSAAIGAIVDAPAKRDLTVEWVLLGLAVIMLMGGVYIFVAALSEHLWLPGLTRIRERVRVAATEHAWAKLILTMALAHGTVLAAERTASQREAVFRWYSATLDFIRSMWGQSQMLIVAGAVRQVPSEASSMNDVLHPILLRMETFLERCHQVPLLPADSRTPIPMADLQAMLGDAQIPSVPAGSNLVSS